MTAPAGTASPPMAGGPALVVGDRTIPLILPRRGDPRLKLSAVIITIQVLGQTLLGFKLSIAQILVSVALGAVIEGAVIFRERHVLAWPASGILTGNSVALLLRASGTRHGDWWSLHGIEFFVLAVVIALATKHFIRPAGRHIFNPSNVGLVWTLLVIGPDHVFPQYLWWGPNDVGVALAYVVIVAGAVWVLRSVHMIAMAAAFMVTFAAAVGVFALAGASFIAIWHNGPVSGVAYWQLVALSPEVLVFVFFMISDPQTAPRGGHARVVYGAATAVVAAALLAFQPTEFGIKLAILASLTVVCSVVPFIERMTLRAGAGAGFGPRRLAAAVRNPVVAAVVIITVGATVNTAVLANNTQVINIERGVTGSHNPQ
jgi:Na+-translocating ferredoxin:NAD+ oxidoreductase RnfD subunit